MVVKKNIHHILTGSILILLFSVSYNLYHSQLEISDYSKYNYLYRKTLLSTNNIKYNISSAIWNCFVDFNDEKLVKTEHFHNCLSFIESAKDQLINDLSEKDYPELNEKLNNLYILYNNYYIKKDKNSLYNSNIKKKVRDITLEIEEYISDKNSKIWSMENVKYNENLNNINYSFKLSTLFLFIITSFLIYFIYIIIKKEKTENELKKQKDLNHFNSKLTSLGEMAAGVAHEINNPLTIITGQANLINNSIASGNELTAEKLRIKIEKIINAAERCRKIVDGMKLLSRNTKNDPLVIVNCRKISDQIIELSKHKFSINQIELKYDFKISEDDSVVVRESEVVQILLNLLNNALDALSCLDTKWVELVVTKNSNTVIFQVLDSGNGIPKSIANKIMDPFFTTKETGKGTGLGLSISSNLAKEMGGRLFLDDKQKNTCFCLEFNLYKNI